MNNQLNASEMNKEKDVRRKSRVSIGMPVYNGENYIKQSLDSLSSQSTEEFEIIISESDSDIKTFTSLILSGLSSVTGYHFLRSSEDGSGNTASSDDMIFATQELRTEGGSLSDAGSDIVERVELDSARSVFDPVGDSTITVSGGLLSIDIPAGVSHNLWNNVNRAPRVRQNANNTNIEIKAKFDSILTEKYQFQGITVEQDNRNFLRFDFYHDGVSTRVYSASFVAGVPTKRIRITIPDGTPPYLRVTRLGDQWAEYYSYDGANWVIAGNYSHSLSVTSVGLFGGNAGSLPPAHTVLVDYFVVDNLPP